MPRLEPRQSLEKSSIGRNIALWQNLWVGEGRFERRSSSARARARRLRSATGSINSGRHILESRCAERCANDAFSTSFRATLRCPETLFISHENANFLFSVFRVVQGEAKNTKNNGVFQGKFCIFTCPKDWHFSWKMNTRRSVQNVTFRLPGSLFFVINGKLAFYLIVSQRYLAVTAKKRWI